MSGAEDLRTRRRRLVQDDLARIAVRLFLERGFDAVSVDEIAEAAAMSQRSFFRYFATKDEVLRRYQRSLLSALLDAFRARPTSEAPLAALRAAYATTSHVPAPDRARTRTLGRLLTDSAEVWSKSVGEMVLDDAIPDELRRRLGTAPADPRPVVLAAAVSAAATVSWTGWVLSDDPSDPADLVVAAIDAIGLT